MTAPDVARDIEIMRSEIAMIPEVMRQQIDRLRAPMAALAAEPNAAHREVILTGCGDSFFAGLGVRLAFERYAGVRCRAVEALELARYEVRYVPVDSIAPLLLAVSYSGEVGRTIEAAAAASDRGWRTVALTGRGQSRLASQAEAILLDVPTLGFSPGTSTYVALLCAMLVLAAELAQASGRSAAARQLNEDLALAPELAATTLRDSESPARQVAELLASASVTTFLGAGPSRASAEFGAAKLFEGPQRHGLAEDLEEWAHEQYFVSGPQTPTVVVSPGGASRDRASELLSEMAFIGVPSVLVTDDPRTDRPTHLLPFAAGVDEPLSALLSCLPLALVAYFLSERLGTRSYGFPSDAHEREHYETIHRAARGVPA